MAPGLVSGVRWADYTTGVRSLGGVSRGVYRRGNMGIAVEWKISDAATSGIPAWIQAEDSPSLRQCSEAWRCKEVWG